MAVFGVEIEETEEVKIFFTSFTNKINDDNLVSNPFHSRYFEEVGFRCIYLKPIYFPVYWLGLLGIIPGVVLSLPIAFYIGLAFMMLTYALWSKYFYYSAMYISLRRAGYKGKIRLLSNDETFERVLRYGTADSIRVSPKEESRAEGGEVLHSERSI